MRKRSTKLSLHRETLRHLDLMQAQKVAGGVGTSAECLQPTGCECESDGCISPTWMRTCGTLCSDWTCFTC